MSNNKNKKYYKKNYYKKNKQSSENKVTYESLLNTDPVSYNNNISFDINKTLIMKYIAITIVLFTIIVCSLILFRHA